MAVKEHPIPQSITTYKFRLVGNMTLQQFFEVAGGVIIAFIVWRLPLYSVIKYPLAIFSASLGAAMAFLPIEERSLDVWIGAFVGHIYKPTLFVFKPRPHPPLYAGFKPRPKKIKTVRLRRPSDYTPPAFKTPAPSPANAKLSEYVNQLFDQVSAPAAEAPANKPKVNPVKLPIAPTSIPKKPKVNPAPKKTSAANKVISPKPTAKIIEEDKMSKPRKIKAAAPVFDPNLPKSQQKNTLNGVVVDSRGLPLPASIVEIKSADSDIPLRITKTNPLGHFFFTHPLPNGKYIIETERDGFDFEPIEINLTGTVVKPIKIIGAPVSGSGQEV